MHFTKLLFTATFLLSFTILLASCDDNDITGPDDPSQVPLPPNFSQMQMETGIFTQGAGASKEAGHESGILAALHAFPGNHPQMAGEPEANPFQLASFLVAMVESAYTLHATYASFFTMNVVPDAVEVSGNEFFWDFSAQDFEAGETIEITVTAVVQDEVVNWTVIASADLEEGGFGEQQIIEGTSAFDGSSGEWSIRFDVPEEGFTYASTTIWDSEAGQLEKLDISTSITEDETGFYQHAEGVYTLDGTNAAIRDGRIQSPEFEGDDYFGDIDITRPFSVSWDIENENGTVTIAEENLCWDENRAAVDC